MLYNDSLPDNSCVIQCSETNVIAYLQQAFINAADNKPKPYFVCCVVYSSETANKKLALISLVSLLVIVFGAVVTRLRWIATSEAAGSLERNADGLNTAPFDISVANCTTGYDSRLPRASGYDTVLPLISEPNNQELTN